jgi:hypothetical protein
MMFSGPSRVSAARSAPTASTVPMAARATKATCVAPSTATHWASRYFEVSWCSRSQAGMPGRRRPPGDLSDAEQGGGSADSPQTATYGVAVDHAGSRSTGTTTSCRAVQSRSLRKACSGRPPGDQDGAPGVLQQQRRQQDSPITIRICGDGRSNRPVTRAAAAGGPTRRLVRPARPDAGFRLRVRPAGEADDHDLRAQRLGHADQEAVDAEGEGEGPELRALTVVASTTVSAAFARLETAWSAWSTRPGRPRVPAGQCSRPWSPEVTVRGRLSGTPSRHGAGTAARG